MAPFFSVCIMTYNRAEMLESILPQAAELPEIEVLVSDNASTLRRRGRWAPALESHGLNPRGNDHGTHPKPGLSPHERFGRLVR